jgi:hypothetical protein
VSLLSSIKRMPESQKIYRAVFSISPHIVYPSTDSPLFETLQFIQHVCSTDSPLNKTLQFINRDCPTNSLNKSLQFIQRDCSTNSSKKKSTVYTA